MPHAETAGVILVGGRSSRMGRDKAQLPWRGVRLVDHVAEMMRQAGITQVFVSGKVDGYLSIPDPVPHLGPVSGLCTSAVVLQHGYTALLAVPVDMPLLGIEALHTLMDLPADADAQHFSNHPLPCALRLSPAVIARSAALRLTPDCAVHRYLSGLKTRAIDPSPAWAAQLRNTNTPEHWASLCAEQEMGDEPAD